MAINETIDLGFFPSVSNQTAKSTSTSAMLPFLTANLSNSSVNHFKMSYTILPNSSIAATNCFPSDRWVFLQDVGGAIRGAQYSLFASRWNTTSQELNFTPAKLDTALSASCVNLTDNLAIREGLKPGVYASKPYSILYKSKLLIVFLCRSP